MNISTGKGHESFANKFANVNGDISKLNKQFFQCNLDHDRLEKLIKDEVSERQVIEKKTYLMNENFTEQLKLLKTGLNSLSYTMKDSIEELKNKMFEDVKNSNYKFMKSFETNLIKYDEYEKHSLTSDQDKHAYYNNLDKKLSILEDIISSQLNDIKNDLKSTKEKNDLLEQKIESNTHILNNSIQGINKEMNMLKNEIEMLKGFKLTATDSFGKITDDMIYSTEQIRNCSNDVSMAIQSAESKMKHFENVFNRLNDSFAQIKTDVSTKIESINLNISKNNQKIYDDVITKLKENKSEIEKFNLNIIKENQKFIEFNQTQLQSQNANMKKLFDYSNDDIDLLKKKSEGLESIIKTMRSEFLNSINQVESSLVQRFDSMFYTLKSEKNYY